MEIHTGDENEILLFFVLFPPGSDTFRYRRYLQKCIE
jgi:hypothetical protein